MLSCSLLSACSLTDLDSQEAGSKTILAEVDGKYLYKDEVVGVTKGYSGKDSVELLKNFARQWVVRQLMDDQASAVVSMNNPEIEKKVEEYRKSLIRAQFERQLVEKRLDTIVTDTAVTVFYQENPTLFILEYQVFQGYFVKIPTNSKDLDKIRNLLSVEENKEELLKLCQEDALFFHLNDQLWFSITDLGVKLPLHDQDKLQIKKGSLIEVVDGGYIYFLYIKDFRKPGEIAPLGYVKNNVKSLLLSRRRVQLLQGLEEEIYNEGIKNKSFKIY